MKSIEQDKLERVFTKLEAARTMSHIMTSKDYDEWTCPIKFKYTAGLTLMIEEATELLTEGLKSA